MSSDSTGHQRNRPSVSIIMPIRNEAAFIERSLGAVLRQDYPAGAMEVLIADGMSSDGTREIIHQLQERTPHIPISIIDNPERIVPTGFNAALRVAQGEIIVRVDGHTEIAPDYVRRCVETLARSGADNVGGRMDPIGETAFGEAVALATTTPFGVGGSRFHYADQEEYVDTVYMGAWPRQVFDRIGYFDDEMVRNQDDEFNYRLRKKGGRILLNPQIQSRYTNRSTLTSLWRQYFQYGFWKVRVFQKVPGSARTRHWIPPLFALAVVGGLPLALLVPFLRPPYLAGLALYALVDLLVSGRIAAQAGWRHLLRLPLVFLVLHLSYGLGFWRGVVHFGPPRQRAASE
jgi:glycosyltransferase involved in cell wall biosynthesis